MSDGSSLLDRLKKQKQNEAQAGAPKKTGGLLGSFKKGGGTPAEGAAPVKKGSGLSSLLKQRPKQPAAQAPTPQQPVAPKQPSVQTPVPQQQAAPQQQKKSGLLGGMFGSKGQTQTPKQPAQPPQQQQVKPTAQKPVQQPVAPKQPTAPPQPAQKKPGLGGLFNKQTAQAKAAPTPGQQPQQPVQQAPQKKSVAGLFAKAKQGVSSQQAQTPAPQQTPKQPGIQQKPGGVSSLFGKAQQAQQGQAPQPKKELKSIGDPSKMASMFQQTSAPQQPMHPTAAAIPQGGNLVETSTGIAGYQAIDLLRMVVEKGGSDLHMTVGIPPAIRISGKLQKTPYAPMSAGDVRRIVGELLSKEEREQLEDSLEFDGAYEVEGLARFRVNVFYNRLGMGSVLRTIPEKILTAEQLGLPKICIDMTNKTKGLVLVTGPTGSGKSTTLAAMIDYVNKTKSEHILTIEDPVEFVHQHQQCVVNQRNVGPNTKSFGNALKAALREDPDIILVGEMRDLETISLAITAAETGHLVFGTLHTSSAAKTIDRIIDVFPADQQSQIKTMIGESLVGIIAQQLCPKVGGGRMCLMEILVGTEAARNLIRDGQTIQLYSVIETGSRFGMQTLDQAIDKALAKGLITIDDAITRAKDTQKYVKMKEEQKKAAANAPGGIGKPGLGKKPGLGGGKSNPLGIGKKS